MALSSSFCYHVSHVFGDEQIPLGDKLQGLVAVSEFILYAASLDAAGIQKLIVQANAVLKKGKKISCPAPQRGIIVGFQAYHQVLLLQLAVCNGRKGIKQLFQSACKVYVPDAVNNGLGE